MRTKACPRCGYFYPEHYLAPFSTNAQGEGAEYVCGICALSLRNKIHNLLDTHFEYGSQAEEMRLAAVKWRGVPN